MAQSPLGGFANLSRYQQAATQVQPNIMDQFVQALNQGVSLAQLPQTLQRENQLQQQQLILGNLKAALAQQQLNDLQNPDAALARKVKEQLTLQNIQRQLPGAEAAPAGLIGETIATPGAITPQQQIALQQGGILPPPVAPGAPITPMLAGGVQTGFNYNPQTPIDAAERERAQNLQNIEDEAAAKGRGQLPSIEAKIRAEAAVRGEAVPKNSIVPPGATVIDNKGNVLFKADPKDTQLKTFSVSPGSKIVDINGKVLFDNPVAPQANVSEDYRTRKSQEILNSITDLKSRVGVNTVGVGATAAGYLPFNTEAADFAADLTALTSQIAFKELAEMRAASKTGGALGQVSDKEGELLKSAIAGLTVKQSPPNFTKNLNRIEESIKRWDAAKAKFGAQPPPPGAATPPPEAAPNKAPDKTREEINAIRARAGLPPL